jgi:tRNA 2-selenouridine synthase
MDQIQNILEGNYLCIDVRTPKEFNDATIPGAVNIPIFSDEERVIIGTMYHQQGKDDAFKYGYDIFNKRINDFLKKFVPYKTKRLAVFCWRGGMRSRAVVELLRNSGYKAEQIEGGHKAYRKYVLERFKSYRLNPKLVILYGLTGTGKSELLNQFNNAIDLEELAQHRSSLFGDIGLKPRSQKMFDSLFFKRLEELKDERHIIVEGESRKIGKVEIPLFFYKAMNDGLKIMIETTNEKRIKRIVDTYLRVYPGEIMEKLDVLQKRLGKPSVDELKALMDRKDYDAVARILLEKYYDPLYKYSLDKLDYILKCSYDNAESELKKFTSHPVEK